MLFSHTPKSRSSQQGSKTFKERNLIHITELCADWAGSMHRRGPPMSKNRSPNRAAASRVAKIVLQRIYYTSRNSVLIGRSLYTKGIHRCPKTLSLNSYRTWFSDLGRSSQPPCNQKTYGCLTLGRPTLCITKSYKNSYRAARNGGCSSGSLVAAPVAAPAPHKHEPFYTGIDFNSFKST
jgi:hypothetical protein